MQKCATKFRNNEPVWEYELESYFLYLSYNCRARFQSYTAIVGAGVDSAILHYITNDAQVKSDDIILIDAGAELWGYGADITRTFPASGKFSEKQKNIYEIVLRTQQAITAILKEGVTWYALNNIARVHLTNELITAGFVKGNFSEIWNSDVVHYFLPHGIGHSLGLDVHDYDFPSTQNITRGAFVTIEPGLYFNNALLAEGFNSSSIAPFLVADVINPYLEIGGVRIEDDYIVTADGYEHVTSVVSSVNDLESVLSKNI